MTAKITIRLTLVSLVSLMFFSCQDPTTHNDPYEGPPKGHIISVERAGEMYDAYSQRRVPIIKKYEDSIASDGSKFEPTRYAEYDLQTIKEYIAYLEHEAAKANVEVNTLRFYLSNYPNSDKFSNGDVVKYPRRNSFFVVPTMAYEGKNVGFSITEVNGKPTAVPMGRVTPVEKGSQDKSQPDSTGQMNEAGFFMSNTTSAVGGTTNLILNDSDLVPPPGTNDFDHTN